LPISSEARKRLCLFRPRRCGGEKRNTWTYFERSEKQGSERSEGSYFERSEKQGIPGLISSEARKRLCLFIFG